jgi:hypothetical protein
MSSRFMRTLLKLYPRRIRQRYGDELLDLQDELSAQDHASRARLIRDMLAGALLVRNTRRVCLVVAAAVVLAGGAVVGTTIGGPSAGRGHLTAVSGSSRTLLRAARRLHIASEKQGCFVAGGSSCSVTPCTEFIAQASNEVVATAGGASATAPPSATASGTARVLVVPHAAPTRCTAYPNARNHRRVFVNARA